MRFSEPLPPCRCASGSCPAQGLFRGRSSPALSSPGDTAHPHAMSKPPQSLPRRHRPRWHRSRRGAARSWSARHRRGWCSQSPAGALSPRQAQALSAHWYCPRSHRPGCHSVSAQSHAPASPSRLLDQAQSPACRASPRRPNPSHRRALRHAS